MIVRGYDWSECDMCNRTTIECGGVHYAYVAQGASGRWCPVLGVCHECLTPEEKVEALTIEQAELEIVTNKTGWPEL